MISLIGGISVLGVAVGVASLIVVLSVMNGFDQEVRKKIIGTYAHVVVMAEGGIPDHIRISERIEAMEGVKVTSPFITGQAVLRKGDSVTGVLLKGIDPEKEREVTEVIKYIGASGGDLNMGEIILGSELMKNDGISIGDTVEILVPYSALDLEKKKMKVVGAFTSGRYDYDSNIGVVSLIQAQELYRLKDSVTTIGIKIDDEMQASSIRDRIQHMLGYPYIAKSWMDLDKNLVAALALEKKMMFIILALIVMVACFNIAGSLIMMVMEKTKDIGILKAIGANSRGIRLVFLVQGALVGFTGIILGGAAGVFIANRVNDVAGIIERITGVEVFPNDVYYFTEIPVKVSPPDVYMIISVAFVLALLAGLYPSWKAARMDPVDAIRYE